MTTQAILLRAAPTSGNRYGFQAAGTVGGEREVFA